MENTKEKSLPGDTFEEKKTMKYNGDEEGSHAKIQKISENDQLRVKQENINSSNSSSPVGKNLAFLKEVPLQTNTDRSSMETNLKDSSSIPKNQDDLLKLVKAKMWEVREENGRLKLLLAQMLKDYQSLQKNFYLNIVHQEEAKKSPDTSCSRHRETEENELISLSLGRGSSDLQPKKDDKKNGKEDHQSLNNEGLSLGLDCRFDELSNSTEPADHEKKSDSENYSIEELKEDKEEPTEAWPPSKKLKTMMRNNGDDHQEVLEQTHLKKTRVSVRARCDTPTMNDGCQWRKYGQKTAKGNPCPRAYYRCTVSPNCPVRKQVQRWVEDMSILITTYEGTHNHPLPISATAMASTTSAAASMLQCHSSTSQGHNTSGLDTSVSAPNSTSTTAANLHGLNFTNLSGGNARSPHPFYFSNTSMSNSNSHPTITLDLTSPANESYFNRLSSAPRYSSTCLNFSSPSSSTNALERPNGTSWNGTAGYSDYYETVSNYNKNHFGILNLGQVPPSYMQMNNLPPPHRQQSLTDQTIAATTKVITSNPNFQSALAAAISSYMANGGAVKAQQNQVGSGDNAGLNMKGPGTESFPIIPAAYSQNQIGCASSFLNKLLSSNSQQKGNMSAFPPSLPFSTSKSASGSPAYDTKDHVNCQMINSD
ncbi:hypothetical protein ACOSP7_018115 [Xanthoceras sorbifolium]